MNGRSDNCPRPDPHQSAFATAVRFVAAQTGGPARILTVHHRRTNGSCAGCTTTPTRWPCTAANIAIAALNCDRHKAT